MGVRILIVEDDESVGAVLQDLLELEGYEVTLTASGLRGALLAARELFDIILLDVDIYDLSGMAVQRIVRDLGDTAVIVMSAESGNWQREAFRAGATACLPKPFGLAALLSLIRFLLSGERPPPGGINDIRALSAEDLRRIQRMSPAELDALPFGLIRVDARGIVTAYNAYESEAMGYSPAVVLGMKFSDLAPCMAVKDFVSACEEGYRVGRLDRVLRFIFPHGPARSVVSVRLYYDDRTAQLWIFVSRRRETPRRGPPERPGRRAG
jgi:photoactive yellow protein